MVIIIIDYDNDDSLPMIYRIPTNLALHLLTYIPTVRVSFCLDNSSTYSLKGLSCLLNCRPLITVIWEPSVSTVSNSTVVQILG